MAAFALRIDLVSGLTAARVLRDDLECEALLRAIAARRRADGGGLIAAPLPAAALADGAAFDAQAKTCGADPRGACWEIDAAALDGAALETLARLRARGWGLGLRIRPGPALALDARARALFSTFIVMGDWDDAEACPTLRTRREAARAQGAALVWAGEHGPSPRALLAEGYDAVETIGRGPLQLAVARSAVEQASSFSIR